VLYSGMRDRLFDVPGTWTLRKCPNPDCGLVWLDPCPVVDDIPKLYRTYYTHGAADRNPVARALDWVTKAVLPLAGGYPAQPGRFRRIAGRILNGIGPIQESALADVLWLPREKRGRLLDVGCGAGQFLRRMANYGWSVAGVDPDPEAVKVARTDGLDVRHGPLEEQRFPTGEFDVITMQHVIEHLPNPMATLAEARRVLRPDGRLVVLTPNTDSLGVREFGQAWLDWDPPRHLILFNSNSMRAVLAAAGFNDISIATPARGAWVRWRFSRQIRARGRVPNMHCGVQPWLWPPSILYHLREYRRIRYQPVGEELLAVARMGGK
jgi:SAM-dependent methyltransferase